MYKRKLIGLAALLLVLALAGCGKNAAEPGAAPASSSGSGSGSSASSGTNPGTGSTSTNTTGASNPAADAPKKPTYEKVSLKGLKPGSEAKVGPLTVKLEEINVVSKAPGLPAGYAYLLARVTVNNAGDVDYTINTSDHLKLLAPGGTVSRVNAQASAQRNPKLQGTLQKGDSATGWLGYLVKVGDGDFQYTFTHTDWGDAAWEFPL